MRLSAAKEVHSGTAAKNERNDRRERSPFVCIAGRPYHKTSKLFSKTKWQQHTTNRDLVAPSRLRLALRATPSSLHHASHPSAAIPVHRTRKLSAHGSASGRQCPPSAHNCCADRGPAFAAWPFAGRDDAMYASAAALEPRLASVRHQKTLSLPQTNSPVFPAAPLAASRYVPHNA